jgi:hypothetical protein
MNQVLIQVFSLPPCGILGKLFNFFEPQEYYLKVKGNNFYLATAF